MAKPVPSLNMEIKTINTTKLYLFELIERTSRFYIHLDEIKAQFYLGDNSKVEDKLIFIGSYKDCLLKIMRLAVQIGAYLIDDTEEETNANCIKNIKALLSNLNILHSQYLSHLPRPSEPIELKRFSRIIDKHVINFNKAENPVSSLSDKTQISIYVSEQLGDSVYVQDPLLAFKDKQLNKTIEAFNVAFKNDITPFSQPERAANNIHITIPRIDTNNPCRWPTLIHELGHHIIHPDFFSTGDIEKEFESFITTEQKEVVDYLKNNKNINLKSWLTECWCDLFACVVFGPAFWFSQYSSFIFETDNNYLQNYPVPLFRLHLINNILTHRFSKTLFEKLKNTISESQSILEYFDKASPDSYTNSYDIRELYIYFREFFRKYFFIVDETELKFGTESVNIKLQPLIKYTEEIHEKTIKDLADLLKDSLPIPSKKINPDSITSKPTYVQEIILAAWMFRNNDLKEEILTNSAALLDKNGDAFKTLYEESVLKIFKRFDQSILRSIQVSEWFDLFYNDSIAEGDLGLEQELSLDYKAEEFKNQLTDQEIYSILKDDSLKVIPIMNLKEQLGSTSLDIRLGTSFQLFYQTKYGIVDFSNEQSLNSAEFNSNLIDLDYLEFITISPGQFILGHTMEYVKLPETIAAEIEGRSSFARLGIEIHMTAGFIDPGFEGVITLEIYNAGPNPVKLYPGVRIGQLKFIPINRPLKPYNKKHAAKYKGLLSHHTSMQFKDYEIKRINEEQKKLI